MHLRRMLAPVAAACALAVSPAHAQFKPGLQLYIEKPSPETGDCGAGDLPVNSVATLTLENSGIRVLRDSSMYLYIHPMVLQEGGTCFVNLEVSVRTRRPVNAIDGFKPKEGWGGLLLCSATVSGVVPRDELASSFVNQLVQQIKLCLDGLEY